MSSIRGEELAVIHFINSLGMWTRHTFNVPLLSTKTLDRLSRHNDKPGSCCIPTCLYILKENISLAWLSADVSRLTSKGRKSTLPSAYWGNHPFTCVEYKHGLYCSLWMSGRHLAHTSVWACISHNFPFFPLSHFLSSFFFFVQNDLLFHALMHH